MSVLLLPRGVCHDIELMLNSFWWGGKPNGGRGIHWARWDKLCAPKAVDGMGFRRLNEFNLTLLCKQDWKLMTEPSSLVANYQSRYYPKSKFLNSSLGTNPSYTWRSSWATRELL